MIRKDSNPAMLQATSLMRLGIHAPAYVRDEANNAMHVLACGMWDA